MHTTPITKDQRGQTMIEMLVALFVISLGLVSMLALSNANLRNQRIGAERLVASQLAREGVEITRNIRDTNWIKGNPWDQGLVGSTQCGVVGSNFSSIDFAGIDCTGSLMATPYRLYRDTTTGVFSRNADHTPTQWYRRVKVSPICLSGTTETIASGTSCATGIKAGVQVTSEVVSSTMPSPVTFTEQLYNWR